MTELFYHTLIIAGFGGQGVLLIGNLIAYAAMREGKHVTYLPFYGVEMRGGTADCTIVISSREIGSPVVDRAQCVIVMNPPSLLKYEHRLEPQGLLLINSSLVNPKEASRTDVHILPIPVNDIANENGNPRLGNMVALGALVEKTRLVQSESLFQSLENLLDTRYHSLIPSNINAIQRGADFIKTIV